MTPGDEFFRRLFYMALALFGAVLAIAGGAVIMQAMMR